MIFETLSTIDSCPSLGKRFQIGFDYLRKYGADIERDGKILINGEDVFAIHEKYQTTTRDKLIWEAHQKYADIQFVISGHEFMGHAFIQDMKVSVPYDPQKDATIFTGEGAFINMTPGTFMVFFPHDVHMPVCAPLSGPGLVRKIVIKVRL